MDQKWMSQYIWLGNNQQLLGQMNIFVQIYLNIFEYPNIHPTQYWVLVYLHIDYVMYLYCDRRRDIRWNIYIRSFSITINTILSTCLLHLSSKIFIFYCCHLFICICTLGRKDGKRVLILGQNCLNPLPPPACFLGHLQGTLFLPQKC